MSEETSIKQYFTGIVKQVMDGGAVVIRGQPRNGPPPTRTLVMAEVEVPRLQRPQNALEKTDDPWGWESREFLRKLLIGKSVMCNVTHRASTDREFGHCLIPKDGSTDPEKAENVAVKLVEAGLAKLRDNCNDQAFKDAEEVAKNAKIGLHSDDPPSAHIRNVTWDVKDPMNLVDRMEGRPVKAVIENVRDGNTIRAFLLPDFYHITLMMSGIRCPGASIRNDGRPDYDNKEEFADEALYFTESRLLQRDVEIILESCNNQKFVGSIIHPNGNIAEALLNEGLAKCVEWSLAKVKNAEKYRQAQKAAQDKKLRLWRNYNGPTGPVINPRDKEFTGKVVEVVNGDAIMVKKNKTETKKIFLASIRPPRLEEGQQRDKGFRALYDIPFMFEAREFLRKKLIGQNVHVIVDYIQAPQADSGFPEKICGTVTIGGINVAEALVSKGLASVVRYSANNDDRSSHYDDLQSAENKAKKSSKGMWSKNTPSRRISDLAGDPAKSKAFLPFLKREGRMQAVVEFVASGSRFRVYIPRETCVITFLLAGISCPRAKRVNLRTGAVEAEGDPFGDEALAHIKEMVLQREVEIEVESMDKGGNFIGWCFVDNTNISVALCEEGYAASHFTAQESNYGRLIAIAEQNAKSRKEKRWANYVEETVKEDDEEEKKDEGERKLNFETVVVTEVTPEAHIYAQHVDEGPKLDSLMNQLREEFSRSPPLAGAFTPKRGELCAAKFVDDQWYRAKVEKLSGKDATVIYIDFGNKAVIPTAKCAALPASFHNPHGFAKEYLLAFMTLAPDEDYAEAGLKAIKEDMLDRKVKLNVEYKIGSLEYVTVVDAATNDDIGKNLVMDGLMMVEKKGGRRLAKVVNSYIEAQDSAKKNHVNIWEYGDITADDAREFGVGAPRA